VEALDEEFVPRGSRCFETGLDLGTQGRVLAPAGRQAEVDVDAPGRRAQQFRRRLGLPLGQVEAVDAEGLGVVGAAPPCGAGDDPAVAHGDALPVGAVPGQRMRGAHAEGVGKRVEFMGGALVERADDQTGHGFLRDTGCVKRSRELTRARPGQREGSAGCR